MSVCCLSSTEYSVNKDYYKVSNQAEIVKSDNLLYYVVCDKDCWWDRYCTAVPLPVTVSRPTCADLVLYCFTIFFIFVFCYQLYMVNKDDYYSVWSTQ